MVASILTPGISACIVLCLIAMAGCASRTGASQSARSQVFVLADTRDPSRCRGGMLEVLAILDHSGLKTLIEFDQAPDRFTLPSGRYRVYAVALPLMTDPSDVTGCFEVSATHAMGYELVVNGADNYVLSVEGDGLVNTRIRR